MKLYFSFFLSLLTAAIWSQTVPPKIIAEGDQFYCPLTEINIVQTFDIVDDSKIGSEVIYIQISANYENGRDLLKLNNADTYATISSSWDPKQGKLSLFGINNGLVPYDELISAVKDVVFVNDQPNFSGERLFSITLGDANFLPSTGHYYEFFSELNITWKEAKAKAESKTYYGLQGYLATLTTLEEAEFSGEQAEGVGWIGGSDEEQDGVWKWVTGPEAGTQFWQGGINGSTTQPYNFAYWANNEPNDFGDGVNSESFAHIAKENVDPNGRWNDLPNQGSSGDYTPQGYVVEYGGMPGDPELPDNLSATTRIYTGKIIEAVDGSLCGSGSLILTAQSDFSTVFWYDSENSTTPIFKGNSFQTPVLEETTTYFVLASEENCQVGERTKITAFIYDIPQIPTEITLRNCDEDGNPDGFAEFNLRNADTFFLEGSPNVSIDYFILESDAETNQNPLQPAILNNSVSPIVYARVENEFGCFSIAKVNLLVSVTSFPDGYIYELEECDADGSNDGFFSFDLTLASQEMIGQFNPQQNLRVQYYRNFSDAQLELNEILPQDRYTNEIAYAQTLYVRVESEDNGDCFGIGAHLQLLVHELPEFELDPQTILCLNLGSTTLSVRNPQGSYEYVWRNSQNEVVGNEQNLVVFTPGKYEVVAISDQNCSSISKNIEVIASDVAVITEEDITVQDNSNNNSITINTSNLGLGIYEFSLDNADGPYQDELVFNNVLPGFHTIFARDKNGCGISQVSIPVIGAPKFFTPNNDGQNDFWQVDGIQSQPNSKIFIFDRYGKVLAEISPVSEGWDGSYNNRLMPSNDYWYIVNLEDGRSVKGSFSLIRNEIND